MDRGCVEIKVHVVHGHVRAGTVVVKGKKEGEKGWGLFFSGV
jgi:hypothetical protein